MNERLKKIEQLAEKLTCESVEKKPDYLRFNFPGFYIGATESHVENCFKNSNALVFLKDDVYFELVDAERLMWILKVHLEKQKQKEQDNIDAELDKMIEKLTRG